MQDNGNRRCFWANLLHLLAFPRRGCVVIAALAPHGFAADVPRFVSTPLLPVKRCARVQ